MLDENKIRQIVQQELQRSNNASRFSVNSIPQHTHDGINSPKIKAENIIPAVSVSGNITFAREDTYTIYLNSSFTPSRIQLYGLAYSVTGTLTFTAASPETVTIGTVYEIETSAGVPTGQFVTITTAGINVTSIVTTGTATTPASTGNLNKVAGTGSGSSNIAYTAITDGTALGARCQIVGSANLGPSFFLQPDSTSSVIIGDIQYPFFDPILKVTVPLQSNSYIWVQSPNIFKALAGEFHIVNVEAGTIYARATVTEFSKDKVVIVVSDLETDWKIQANIVIT
jgi:hypothetical protein